MFAEIAQDVAGGIQSFLPAYIVPLILTTVFGALIGLDRQSWNKPAGLRTHVMVTLGFAVFTLLSLQEIAEGNASGVDSGDPSRAIVGVATGLGFLGAGTIIRHQGTARGITTASGIWVLGEVGVRCGARQD